MNDLFADLGERLEAIRFQQVGRTMRCTLSDCPGLTWGTVASSPMFRDRIDEIPSHVPNDRGVVHTASWGAQQEGYLRSYEVYMVNDVGSIKTTYCLVFYNQQCEQVFVTGIGPLNLFLMFDQHARNGQRTMYLSSIREFRDRRGTNTMVLCSITFEALENSDADQLQRWLKRNAEMQDVETLSDWAQREFMENVLPNIYHRYLDDEPIRFQVEDRGHHCPDPNKPDFMLIATHEMRLLRF